MGFGKKGAEVYADIPACRSERDDGRSLRGLSLRARDVDEETEEATDKAVTFMGKGV